MFPRFMPRLRLWRGWRGRRSPSGWRGTRFSFAALGFLHGLLLAGPSTGLRAAEAVQLRPWTDYRTVMWVGETARKHPEQFALFLGRLREMGVNTGMVYADADPQPYVEHQFPYYVENLVNRGLCLKWHSRVADWDAFVTGWNRDGRPEGAFVRDYCLEDPGWRAWARSEVERTVLKNRSNQPLAYDLRDELSTTLSANPFDYDFSPASLAAFRGWLRTEYRDLAALNRDWETSFARWEDVVPFTTDQVKNRMASGEARPQGTADWRALQELKFDPATARQEPTRWNLSPWCDFRTFMDVSLARTLDDLRRTAHVLDPRTPVGIEGTQMPHAFGGYDLWRLAQVLDWVEPYDLGNAREILGSFMPGKTILTTVFESDTPHARRRLWHLLLEGDRGCLIWWSDDCFEGPANGFALTPKARALAPVLKEMTGPLARLFMRASRQYDPVCLYYSQPSIQVDWLLESTVDGSTWPRRFSSFEFDHNRMAKARQSWLQAFQDLGFSPRFVAQGGAGRSFPGIEAGQTGVLVLPTALALSDQERAWILARAAEGVVILADGTPGDFDQHGRLVGQNTLAALFPPARPDQRSFGLAAPTNAVAASRGGDIAAYTVQRAAAEPDFAWARWIGEQVRAVPREVTVPLEARARIHRYRLGSARLLAFERNITYQVTEDLKQAGGNERLEVPVDVEARLLQPGHIYDLRSGRYLGRTDRILFQLDPWQPALFVVLPEPVRDGGILEWLEHQPGAGAEGAEGSAAALFPNRARFLAHSPPAVGAQALPVNSPFASMLRRMPDRR